MRIPVKFLNFNESAPDKGYWDQHFLLEIFKRPEFEIVEALDEQGFGVVVVPGRQNVGNIDKINNYISRLQGVLFILTGEEEGAFEIEKITHPNIKIWLMTPQQGRLYTNVDKFFGDGHTPHMSQLPKEVPDKTLRWFFAGQATNQRRYDCCNELRRLNDGELVESPTFAGGLSQEEYVKKMAISRVVPCPGGPQIPDTFRVFEALEAGCIPLVDEYSAKSLSKGYWHMIFGENIPFPIVRDWTDARGLINYFNDTFTHESNKIFAWWQMYKRNFANDLIDHYCIVAGVTSPRDAITVLVPTSPIASNPDTSMIEETIASIRAHLPEAEILLTFDGVRAEQEARRANYEEFTRKVLWKCNRQWHNVIPMVFEEHVHQVGMARAAMKVIRTRQLLYVEHDAPLTPDMPIEWDKLTEAIDTNQADLIRFHFEAKIPEVHNHMMLDSEPQIICGAPMVRTVQWSQRPHLASTVFYKRILDEHFSWMAKSFIEDKMHSVVLTAWDLQQLHGWNLFKLWIYHPEGNIKRSYNLDGRGDEKKYDMIF